MARKKNDFDSILQEYRDKYDVDSIVNPNDIANLESMIRNQLLIQKLQEQLDELARNDDFDSMTLKKLLDGITALSQTNVQLERTLGIDRKTRKTEQSASFPEYLVELKKLARPFMDNRLVKVYCKPCNIMVGRISAVYDTTEFQAMFQCPQCKKYTTVTRKERDIFFDIKNADWRRKYKMEVIQPKRSADAPMLDVLDDVVLGIDDDVEFSQ